MVLILTFYLAFLKLPGKDLLKCDNAIRNCISLPLHSVVVPCRTKCFRWAAEFPFRRSVVVSLTLTPEGYGLQAGKMIQFIIILKTTQEPRNIWEYEGEQCTKHSQKYTISLFSLARQMKEASGVPVFSD